uniref:Bifunctional inhibitor/plant lipid transfer protein/seed storage helical domain-containing protein n=1 Tax=Salix viminalis TaxID=40686 RepID=A0A6N2L3B0_SALVM
MRFTQSLLYEHNDYKIRIDVETTDGESRASSASGKSTFSPCNDALSWSHRPIRLHRLPRELGTVPQLCYWKFLSPSPSCCSQLATIVQSQPRCLCALVNGGGSSLGIAINQTLALALPTACNVQTPPISRCNAADGPATPPASSPAIPPSDTSDATPEAPTTVSTPSIPAGSGSKTVPTSTGTSDASIVRKQLHLDIFVMLAISLAATLCAVAMAQSSCTNVIISMSPCLNYITGNSSSPSSSCCTQLANVVKSQPQCLCEVVNGGASSLGSMLIRLRLWPSPALAMSKPSISRCNGTPNPPSAGTGSKAVPSADNGTSDANSTKLTMSLLFFLLFITSLASTLVTI